MADETTTTPPENTETPVTLESISAKEPDQLDDKDKDWLNQNADTLEDDVADKYNIIKTPKDVKPEVRGGEQTPPPATPPAGTTPPEDEDDDDFDEEDQKRITKAVAKELERRNISGVTKQVQEAAITAEVDDFIRTTTEKIPLVGKYREAMLNYAKHPAYSQIPIKAIFNIVAGDNLMKLGAQKEREASKKVATTKVEANSSRQEPGKKDWTTASPEDFAAKRAAVLGRPV